MKIAVGRTLATSKSKIDLQLRSQRGNFSGRTPKELDKVFGIDYKNLSTTKDLHLLESSLDRISIGSQEFLLNAFNRYTLTFPEAERLKREFDSFKGNHSNMRSMTEFFLRTLVMSCYEEGVSISLNDPILMDSGINKGNHDLCIYRGDYPVVILRFAKRREDINGSAIEQSFCNNIFELYTAYWKNPVWPLFGCISDLNSWMFLKYDGKDFYRSSKVYKLALHNTAILSLSIKFLNIIDSKIE